MTLSGWLGGTAAFIKTFLIRTNLQTSSYSEPADWDSRSIHTEHGAALVLSQSTLGDVAVILYAYSSERLSRIQPHIIWAIFSDPTQITDAVLNSATRDFFRYVRVSSALFSESSLDRLRIQYLEFRSKKYTGGGGIAKLVFSHWSWVFLGAVGSVASIYSLWK